MTLPPLLDRLAGLVVWLTDRIAVVGDPAEGEHAWLDRTQAGALIARLRRLAARFRAVAGTPAPPPKPAPGLAEPRFVPACRSREVTVESLSAPPGCRAPGAGCCGWCRRPRPGGRNWKTCCATRR